MPQSSLPLVAIVGQPNVGKSTLLNKIAGHITAVTSPVAGTTRDRQYVDTSWNGVNFTLVDTAGLSLDSKDELEHSLNTQIDIAVQEADLVVLVVDARLNHLSVAQTTLHKFRNIKKPVVLAINKADSPNTTAEKIAEFQSLGIKSSFPISSLSGRGVGDLLDHITAVLTEHNLHGQAAPALSGIRVSIVGKPNVGKSSIFNAILKEDRVVVSPVPGTTRTAIDEQVTIAGQDFVFIDTAGLKKKEHRQEQPDVYAGFQTFKSIRRSDVCFLVIDVNEEITKQDQRVAHEIFEAEKGVIILANKTDLAAPEALPKKKNGTFGRDKVDESHASLRNYISMHFPFLWMSPLFFVSAKTGEGLNDAIAAIKPIYERRQKEINEQALDEFLNKKLKTNPPKLLRDQKKPKVYSLHQTDINPPTFQMVVNHPAAISQQFRKFMENSIIKELDFWGTPIKMRLIAKDKM